MKRLPLILLWIVLLLSLYNAWRIAQLRQAVGDLAETRATPAPTLQSPPAVESLTADRVKELETLVLRAWSHTEQAQALLRESREAEAEREIDRALRTLLPVVGRLAETSPKSSPQGPPDPHQAASLSDALKKLLQERVRREEQRSP
jgi:hypothetical protein